MQLTGGLTVGTQGFTAIFSLALLGLISSQSPAQTSIRFAAVGDFDTTPATGSVAAMIASWNPDFVITQGDNNYTANNTSTASWDNEVGQFYGQYIKYPTGSSSTYAPGPSDNGLFPCVGNHDWDAGITGWYNYFDLPGNERYFDFIKGPVHFFVIDSDSREPDGITSTSVQAQWLQAGLASSTLRWKIVFFHHPPYTSASRGNNTALQWPFKQWGATAVLNGHEHHYERIIQSGFPYIVNGAGGRPLSGFSTPIPGSVFRYSANNGAMLIEAGSDSIEFKFYSIVSGGTLVDRYAVHFTVESTLVDQGSTWKYLDDNSDQGTAWRLPAFNDASWSAGPAKLGFGGDGEVTTVNGGPSGARYITTYFRRSFFFDDPSRIAAMTLDVLRDDGAIVYLNGTEQWRTNMPTGTITHSTFASSAMSGSNENTFFSTQPVSPMILPGLNVLAVEVHQINLTSSDLGFDLRLSATLNESSLATQQLTMTAGWNLISLPLTVSSNAKTSLFPTASSDAFAFVGGYVPQSLLDIGLGYWLRFDSVQDVSISGSFISADTIAVNPGWNLIGSISGPVNVATITSIPNGIVTSQFFGYDGAYVATSTIEPGKAYWVQVSQSGQLILVATTP